MSVSPNINFRAGLVLPTSAMAMEPSLTQNSYLPPLPISLPSMTGIAIGNQPIQTLGLPPFINGVYLYIFLKKYN